MKTVLFSPLAQDDISDIWDYTVAQWGEKQAVTYTHNLREASVELATGLAVSQTVDIREGYLKYRSGEHFIYFKETDANITVIRILHKSMDVGRHL